jgi:hypothetical protein
LHDVILTKDPSLCFSPASRSEIYEKALSHGALIQPTVQPNQGITHCVTATSGTEKTYKAFKLGIRVVWVGWFWRCLELLERVKEGEWQLNADGRGTETRTPEAGNGNNGQDDGVRPIVQHSVTGDPSDNALGEGTGDGHMSQEITDDNDGNGDAGDFQGEGEWDDAFQAELDGLLEGEDGDSEFGDGGSVSGMGLDGASQGDRTPR